MRPVLLTPWEEDCQKYRGEVLTGQGAHWCNEWDGLPIDETCYEWPCCHFAFGFLPRQLKKWAKQGFPKRRRVLRLRLAFNRLHRWPEIASDVVRLTGEGR